jgi:hypothetical protein
MNEFFSIYLILPAALGLGFTQLLKEMSTRSRRKMFLGSRARPVRRADNLTAMCEPNCLDNVGPLTSHNPIDLHGLLQA